MQTLHILMRVNETLVVKVPTGTMMCISLRLNFTCRDDFVTSLLFVLFNTLCTYLGELLGL